MHLNFNVGLVGHVDSGKTSLAKVLSNVASTAAFDKSKQSQERGITLDLGFSSFKVIMPKHLRDKTELEALQFTLVDCPGHASLIRTIIGGAQIVDLLLLVVDATKGIQTQTGECIVIGELTCSHMIVVINKVDLIPVENRSKAIEKLTKRLKHVLNSTSFKIASFVSTAAGPSEGDPIGINDLIEEMSKNAYLPCRNKDEPFFMAVDHCFNVSGRGTILTGTVIQGQITVKDEIEFPAINISRAVKSIQVFREEQQHAEVGDRIGLCVSKFDKKLMERGIACAANYAIRSYAIVIPVLKIIHFKSPILSGSKFHISIGHETCMATVTFFSLSNQHISNKDEFDYNLEYKYEPELVDELINSVYYALLEFDKFIYTMPKCLVIGSKLDMDVHTSGCRLAFYGHLLCPFSEQNYRTVHLQKIKVYKTKRKEGVVDRLVNENELIVKNMFHKETNTDIFVNLMVTLSTGETGRIEGRFGQTGKVKIVFDDVLKPETINVLNKKRKESSSEPLEPVRVCLEFKSYLYDKNCKLKQ